MKKKIFVLLIAIIIIIPVFYYGYAWNLNNRFSDTNFTKCKVHQVLSKKEYLIDNMKKVNQIYHYISKQHGRKYAEWFFGGLHGLAQGDENYSLEFIAEKGIGEFVSLYIVNGKGYLSFTDGFYCLDRKTFNVKEFKQLIK